ncbi:MAG TPA: type II secretion system major pseudopilin GspG [Planctomycetaceae bacterium]|nr:type II secretion system major pseudopilin GspG [Planctomycetaceae bacterium]
MLARRFPSVRRRTLHRGFTLIEVLLVLAILGVIAAMVVPNLLGTQKEAMIKQARNDIAGLEQAMKLYAVKNYGEYPSGGQEIITQLMQTREVDGRVEAPLLDKPPRDPWGTMLFYQYPGRNNQQSGRPDIWSAGPNRQDDQGSGDDINNWSDSTL